MQELVQLFAEEDKWHSTGGGGGGGGGRGGGGGASSTAATTPIDDVLAQRTNGAVAHFTQTHPKYGKIFKCRAELRAPLEIASQVQS